MIVIDFIVEVEKCKEVFLVDLFSFLEINLECDDSKVDVEYLFGFGLVKVLEKFFEIVDCDGYLIKNVDNYVGYFEFGDGEEVFGIFVYMDVVLVGSGWDIDFYILIIKDGCFYVCGVLDDKGFIIVCYYGLKIIKELGFLIFKKVCFIVGIDEELGWVDMDYYFEYVGFVKLDFGFFLDVEFFIINGEKGNIMEYFYFVGENVGAVCFYSFIGGLCENMVLELVIVVVLGDLVDL